ncbi:MAG TPA: phosphate ABC transporter permease subunit PstC [Blastocatellia bacterium]|nr:phosphate ABC transporter permease subunit PstC [Blastocatellia bacterium]
MADSLTPESAISLNGAGKSSLAGRQFSATRSWQYWKERSIESLLFLAAFSSVAITLGIVGTLIYESSAFFSHVSIVEFLTGRFWTPLFADPRFGILPLVTGTLVTTAVALMVSIPIGTLVSIYLSEFAPATLREVIKPAMELLSAVPTVVYGYFALQFVAPLMQKIIPGLPTFNMLSAGTVMGIMIIPYVSSLSEDAMSAVPMSLREGAYALGANRIITAFRVVYPAALSGIISSYLLAVSRAVGETMIVAIAAGMQPNLTLDPREPAETITAFIVQVSLGDLPHGSTGYQSIFAAGLTLFVMTLAFNIIGYLMRKRFREVY